VIASSKDALYFSMSSKDKYELDIDDTFDLAEIKCILYHKEKFYLLANKHNSKLGYFLLEFDSNLAELSPNKEEAQDHFRYIIKWVNKLNIGDAGLEVLERIEETSDG
jgi:hypothetical protein